MSCGFGLGETNVEPLAQWLAGGNPKAGFLNESYNAAFLQGGALSQLPADLYADDSTAQSIAQALGGSVYQAPPPGNYQGTNIPPANWIQLPDGTQVLAGNLATLVGIEPSFGDSKLCAFEQMIIDQLPGGAFGASCPQSMVAANPLITGDAVTAPPVLFAPTTPAAPVAVPLYYPPALSTPTIPTPVLPITPVTPLTVPPASAQVVNSTAGSNVGSTAGATASSDVVTIGGWPIIDLSQVPWWGWGIAAGVALWAVSKVSK